MAFELPPTNGTVEIIWLWFTIEFATRHHTMTFQWFKFLQVGVGLLNLYHQVGRYNSQNWMMGKFTGTPIFGKNHSFL